MGKFVPSAPKIEAPPAPPPVPSLPDRGRAPVAPDSRRAREAARRRAQAAFGSQSTIVTGPQGLAAPATTASKRLLGQ